MTTPKHHTVLWADDDADDLLIMREALAQLNYQHPVIEVPNGKRVLLYLASLTCSQHYPCLIILDNNMPLMSGKETLENIRKELKYRDIPVVMFSTSISKQEQAYFRSLGAYCYTKPFTIGAYKGMLTELLSHCGMEETKLAPHKA